LRSMSETQHLDVHASVQEYYGKELKSKEDLKTSACTTQSCGKVAPSVRSIFSKLHEETLSKYYGCGLCIPPLLDGLRVLDLGSGSGVDCFVVSKLVGPNGYVVGVDMTDEQLEVANRHIDFHMKQWGFVGKPNVEFKKGFIEQLDQIDLADNSFDIVISNCVLNLAKDKAAVLRQVYRVLKDGGEFYFSDVYSDRRIDEQLRDDSVLYGECLSGALYWNDFLNLAKKCGFDVRLVSSEPIDIQVQKLKDRVGNIKFTSATFRLWKIAQLEPDCEDYGQAVIYRGTIPGSADLFQLDDHHSFEKGKLTLVCGNTFLMLNKTRFSAHFEFIGDFSKHFGIFPGCGKTSPFTSSTFSSNSTSCSGAGCHGCC